MSNYEEFAEQRGELAYYMRRLYEKNLTTSSGGNISMRLPGDLVLVTPSVLDKGVLAANQVVLMDMSGENLSPELRPSIEAEMHLEIYRRRADARAVVHAHPAFATSFACSDVEIEIGLTPELVMAVGRLARAMYHPAGTVEVAAATADALLDANVALMQNHGVTSLGPTLYKAFDRLEVTEMAAKMTWITRSLGGCRPLDGEQRQTILDLLGI